MVFAYYWLALLAVQLYDVRRLLDAKYENINLSCPSRLLLPLQPPTQPPSHPFVLDLILYFFASLLAFDTICDKSKLICVAVGYVISRLCKTIKIEEKNNSVSFHYNLLHKCVSRTCDYHSVIRICDYD